MNERQRALDSLTFLTVIAGLVVMLTTPPNLHAAIAQYAVPAVLLIMAGVLVLGAGRDGGES